MTQQNIPTKLVVGIIALIVVVAGLLMVLSPGGESPAPAETMQDELKALAVEAAGMIDGDALAALKPGDETTPEFTAIRDRLAAFRDANTGVLYVYTMRNVNDTIEYVVDADYRPGDTPAIGSTYRPTDDDSRLLAGFAGPSAESELSTEEWDNTTATIISGYAPVKDSTGAIVGIVGVDMGSSVAKKA
ncbi:hypothetical protein DSECCO2_657690 [anaerobic digester metagenome]